MSQNPVFAAVEQKLRDCEAAIQYQFRDRKLLELCLTHASVARTRLDSNERLEFLGDAILGAVVCEILYHRFPEEPEGELTRIKSSVVSRNTCAQVAEELQLETFLLLGKGIRSYDGIPLSIKAGVYESLVAGIHLDGGQKEAQRFVERTMSAAISRASMPDDSENYKSLLQQYAQKHFAETPVYRLLDEKGPDHLKCFEIAAMIGTNTYPPGWGPSKKEAEQRAAQNALQKLEDRPKPPTSE